MSRSCSALLTVASERSRWNHLSDPRGLVPDWATQRGPL